MCPPIIHLRDPRRRVVGQVHVLAVVVAVFHPEQKGMVSEPFADEFLVYTPPFRLMLPMSVRCGWVIDNPLIFVSVGPVIEERWRVQMKAEIGLIVGIEVGVFVG